MINGKLIKSFVDEGRSKIGGKPTYTAHSNRVLGEGEVVIFVDR
jgi:hypothetical protein